MNKTKEKNYKRIIIFQLIVDILVIIFILLAVSGVINLSDETPEKCTNVVIDNDTDDISITILSMNKPTISTETPNNVMTITGEMKLSFNEDKYSVVNITGTCTGKEGEKYNIFGPGSGAIGLHNGETEYMMVESIGTNEDAIYPDGTIKKRIDIDWTKVEIKSCEIESLKAYSFVNDDEILLTRRINYKKEFN